MNFGKKLLTSTVAGLTMILVAPASQAGIFSFEIGYSNYGYYHQPQPIYYGHSHYRPVITYYRYPAYSYGFNYYYQPKPYYGHSAHHRGHHGNVYYRKPNYWRPHR